MKHLGQFGGLDIKTSYGQNWGKSEKIGKLGILVKIKKGKL